MDETRYRVESEAHYEILDNLWYAPTLKACEWAVSSVQKMPGAPAGNLGLRVGRMAGTA